MADSCVYDAASSLFFLIISLNCSSCCCYVELIVFRAIIIVRKFDHDTIDEDREMANCRNTLGLKSRYKLRLTLMRLKSKLKLEFVGRLMQQED